MAGDRSPRRRSAQINPKGPTGPTGPSGPTGPQGATGATGPALALPLTAAPGTPGYDSTWYALTQVFWDPANSTGLASDANSGATALLPVLTWGEIIRRYGSVEPVFNYGQSVRFTVMSSQPAGQDPIFFAPKLSAGAIAYLDCLTYAVAAGANFTLGALSGGYGYAAATPAVGGVQMTAAGVPGYVVAGTLLYNVSLPSYAFVDAVSAGNATLASPLTAASIAAPISGGFPVGAQQAWVAGNTIKPLTLLSVNLKEWKPVGGDVAGGTPCAGWIIGANIADSSGTEASDFGWTNTTAINVISLCYLPKIHAAGLIGRSSGLYILGCSLTNGLTVFAGVTCVVESGIIASGIELSSGAVIVNSFASLHGGNAVLGGSLTLSQVFSDGSYLVGSQGGAGAPVGAGIVSVNIQHFGTYSVTIGPGSAYVNNGASTFTASALLTNGALKFGTATTGSAYAGSGVFVDGISLTPAHIDTGGTGGVGLQDPLTGARFCQAS